MPRIAPASHQGILRFQTRHRYRCGLTCLPKRLSTVGFEGRSSADMQDGQPENPEKPAALQPPVKYEELQREALRTLLA